MFLLTSSAFSGNILRCQDGTNISSDSTKLYSDTALCINNMGFGDYVPSDSVLDMWKVEDSIYLDSMAQVKKDNERLSKVYKKSVIEDTVINKVKEKHKFHLYKIDLYLINLFATLAVVGLGYYLIHK